MKNTYIIGHRNPDTDSICSAIAYANLKNELNKNAIACRLGPLNDETKFVLNTFKVEPPLIIKDARSQIKDINYDQANLINENATIKEAWKTLLSNDMHGLCVIDDNENFKGFITSSNLSKLRLTNYQDIALMMKNTSVSAIAKTLKGNVELDFENHYHNGNVFILTLIEENSIREKVKDSICITSDNTNMQKNLIMNGAKILVIAYGLKPEQSIIDLATKHSCAIITTPKDSMAIAQVINESFSVKNVMSTDIISFNTEDYVEDIAKKMQNTRYRSYPIFDKNNKLVGTISRYHLFKHSKKHFILVDHSEKGQSVENIEKAYIEEIIDHHHIGNIETGHPIYYRNERCGCTSTIIAALYKENNIIPSKEMAGLMLSAIISDTLFFKSSTTTKKDIEAAKELAKLAEVDIEKYAIEVLNASVSLIDSTPKEILNRDLKLYKINGYDIAVGQSNYYETEGLQTILPEFKNYFDDELESKGYDLLVMMFTHVTGEGSQIVYGGKISTVIDQFIETKISENIGYDHNIISRKQQLLPKLNEYINEL